MRVVVTGAGRGLGLEMVRQLLDRGARIEAAVRSPAVTRELRAIARQSEGRVSIRPCDVASDQSVQEFARGLIGQPIDVLINCAGAPPVRDRTHAIEPGDQILQTLNVNAVGPLRVTRALLPNLRAGIGRRVANITSTLGSLTDVRGEDTFGYRMSKAALNMFSRLLSNGCRRNGIATVLVHPGWVQTAMGGPNARVPVYISVKGILDIIERLTLRASGRFVDYRGHRMPW